MELIGSEKPNLSDPQWLRRLYILVNMTRRLNTLNLRPQGNKRAWLILFKARVCRFHVDMWTEQMAAGDGTHFPSPNVQSSKYSKMLKITELIDENNTIILEEIDRVYRIQITLMSIATFGGNIQMRLD